MRHADLAALRWVEVTVRRAGHQAVSRYSRYAHELLDDPDTYWARLEASVEDHPDLAMDVWEALRSIPKEERQVLFLSVVADWPQSRIAVTLHRSQARVSQLRHQALVHMRELLQEGETLRG